MRGLSINRRGESRIYCGMNVGPFRKNGGNPPWIPSVCLFK
ncbi:hypothetical protein HMPREF3039_02292 [Akkermansia sp. KLE1798]|nr:hypothetical protein HMPREF3039_02292 [Akkermansia sp. KLE1798]KZA05766.1 hypothetical protein HMPREF1326_00592 [Akkermansia sp. KLE1605]